MFPDRFNQLNAIITAQREELDRQRVLNYELHQRIAQLIAKIKGGSDAAQYQVPGDEPRVA
jgi:hypothetical protein